MKEFPDPFLKNDGKRVKNVEDGNVRRYEITDLIMNIEYGTMPDALEEVKVEISRSTPKHLAIPSIILA